MENLTLLSDAELLTQLSSLVATQRRQLARLLSFLGEVEERRLHLLRGYSSLFDFCTTALHFSEGEAFRRIAAARLARRFPEILELVSRGDLHLTALVLLRDHLTAENHSELLSAATHKSKRDIELLIAQRFPRSDVKCSVRKLPAPQAHSPLTLRALPSPIEPIAPARYRVQLTASQQLKDKLERARQLLGQTSSSGDLAPLFERALDLLLADLESSRRGKTQHPRRRAPLSDPGAISRAARRTVFERDGEQCTFVAPDGRRCPSQVFLELDHVHPRAFGGPGKPENLRILCRAHNQLLAEKTFGKAHIAGHLRQRGARETA